MARVPQYQSQINRQLPTDARLRAADYGPGALGPALQSVGEGLGKVADVQDKVEQVKAGVEADRLQLEHSEQARIIGRTVKETLGDGAEAAADAGAKQLKDATDEILGRASPRAKALLQSRLGERNVVTTDNWYDHGHGEMLKAAESHGNALIASTIEDVADEPDEGRARELFKPVVDTLRQQASLFGKDEVWVKGETQKYLSHTLKSRALKLAAGANGSALDAINYAVAHRSDLTDDDYNSVLTSYQDNADDETATMAAYGQHAATTIPAEPDPLAPLADGKRALDPVALWKAHIMPWEGGAKVVVDTNGTISKFGINAKANPGVDVANLTEKQAYDIYYKKYFLASGADKLPPALAAVHCDTYYLNQREASRILKECGGNVDKYVALREQFLNGLAAKDPEKYGPNQKGWHNRTEAVSRFADRQGTDGTAPLNAAGITADSDLTPTINSVMARTDIGLRLKTKIIAAMKGVRSDLTQERSVREGAAADSLSQSALSLGEGFTDVKQLPQDAWLSASPQARTALTNQAKSNVEQKPLAPEMASLISFTEMSDPKKFASKEFLMELQHNGAPASTIRTVAARQGQIAGNLAGAKPDPIASGELWTIAKPAFEANGLLFDTTEAKGIRKGPENIQDTQRKSQAVGFLRDMAVRWAQANPGKHPTEEEQRKWVGYALRHTTRGRAFELPEANFYLEIPQSERIAASRAMVAINPSWLKKSVTERQHDIVEMVRTRAATGR